MLANFNVTSPLIEPQGKVLRILKGLFQKSLEPPEARVSPINPNLRFDYTVPVTVTVAAPGVTFHSPVLRSWV